MNKQNDFRDFLEACLYVLVLGVILLTGVIIVQRMMGESDRQIIKSESTTISRELLALDFVVDAMAHSRDTSEYIGLKLEAKLLLGSYSPIKTANELMFETKTAEYVWRMKSWWYRLRWLDYTNWFDRLVENEESWQLPSVK